MIGAIFLLSLVLLFSPAVRKTFEFVFKNIPEKISQQIESTVGVATVCYSPDGINIEKREKIGRIGGSSGIILKDGTIILGGLDFSDREGIKDEETGYRIRDIGFWASKDGWKFSKLKLNISSLERDITAYGDPTIVQLPNGGYRMYFTERTTTRHAAGLLMSAYSEDGYNYHFEGKVISEPTVNLDAVDFTVLYEKKSKKYYIYTRAENFDEAWILESKDGKHFTKRFKIKIPFAFQFSIVEEDDHYVAYGGHIPADIKPCTDLKCPNLRYPVRAISRDGINWQRTTEQPDGLWQGDRTYCNTYAVLKLSDGYYFY